MLVLLAMQGGGDKITGVEGRPHDGTDDDNGTGMGRGKWLVRPCSGSGQHPGATTRACRAFQIPLGCWSACRVSSLQATEQQQKKPSPEAKQGGQSRQGQSRRKRAEGRPRNIWERKQQGKVSMVSDTIGVRRSLNACMHFPNPHKTRLPGTTTTAAGLVTLVARPRADGDPRPTVSRWSRPLVISRCT